jgi:hypothetical protein
MSGVDELVQKVMEAVLVKLTNETQPKLKLIGTSDSNVLNLIARLPKLTARLKKQIFYLLVNYLWIKWVELRMLVHKH